MSIRLEFDIDFKSDFHVSAGHGLGQQVDSALLRDADDVPVIRGTELTGLLRDSLMNLINLEPLRTGNQLCKVSGAQVEQAFCGQFAPDSQSTCPVCAVFGSPRHMKHWHISSARPVDLITPQVKSQDWRPGETAAQVTTRVRVNPRTRRAEENKLFTREEGDSSLHFRFTAECLGDDETTWREAEWLTAAARMLRNLGAGKRRGYGECEIHLANAVQESMLLDRFDSRLNGKEVKSGAEAQEAIVEPLTLSNGSSQHSYRLRVLLRTDEPLLVARRAEAGNQFETQDCIPGSVLRGALAWRVAQRARDHLDSHGSSEYHNFAALFFQDAVRFSAMLPVEMNPRDRKQGYPTIPAPRDLQTCELHPGYSTDKGHGVWSMARDEHIPDQCPACAASDNTPGSQGANSKLETVNGFVSLVSRAPRSKFQPKMSSEMHIRIEPKSGRVRTGDLFGYISLESGQYFVGEITCTDESVWLALQRMIGLESPNQVHELRLGKAARRGYGKTSVVFQPATQSPWQGPSLTERVSSLSNVVLLMLSDTIVTDPWGRFECGFGAEWIERELELPAGSVIVDPERCFSAMRAIDKFNATLGLPRARDLAIVAGSSVQLTFSGIEIESLLKKLHTAETQGIGLRRNEGFGWVSFNHPIYEKLANWKGSALDLSAIELADRTVQLHPSTALLQFLLEWVKKLNNELKPGMFKDERFETVARLLHVSRGLSSSDVSQYLGRVGTMEGLLAETLKGRDKSNFFDGDGKKGMEAIGKFLSEMETLLEPYELQQNTHAWRMGLQVLADRIAEPARQKAQERR